MNNNKLIWPIAVVISSLILGGSLLFIQINKQNSIEKQKQLDVEQEEAKLIQEKEADEAEAEQSQKEYVANRKNDCLDIYKTEDEKWNNIQGWRYDETDDRCYIRYKNPKPKSDAECDEDYPVDGDLRFLFLRDNMLCKDGEFENSF